MIEIFSGQSSIWLELSVIVMLLVAGLYYVIYVLDDATPLTFDQKQQRRRNKRLAKRILWGVWVCFVLLQLVLQRSDSFVFVVVVLSCVALTGFFLRIAGPECCAASDAARTGTSGQNWPWK
jgi:hypothetical protein